MDSEVTTIEPIQAPEPAPQTPPAEPTPPAESAPPTGLSDELFTAAEAEYLEKGEVSKDTLSKFEAHGIKPERVKRYIAGQEAATRLAADDIYATVGGKENYEAARQWASTLPEAERNAFNETLKSTDINQVKSAVAGLYARYRAVSPPGRKIVGSPGPGPATGFDSFYKMKEAMKDPRYGKDPAYTKEVENRAKVSTW